ncbi:MAG: AmmeMemoRadiSam system protein B [Patescibacteria group bacterium]
MSKALIGALIITLGVLSGCGQTNTNQQVKGEATEIDQQSNVLRSYLMDSDFYERSFAAAENTKKSQNVVAGIFPHHLLANYIIADFFSRLDNDPPTIVLLSPNHFDRGKGQVMSTDFSWDTPNGLLEAADGIIASLADQGIILRDDQVLSREHGISGVVPYIKKQFPQTQVIPLVIKNTIKSEALDDLAEKLMASLPADALVLASVDFSHEVMSAVAERQDKESYQVIKNFNYSKIKDIKADSWASLYLVMKIAQRQGANNIELLTSSNSAIETDRYDSPVTSYLTVYFKKVRLNAMIKKL